MNPDPVLCLIALILGFAGGVFFFQGLYWTVKRVAAIRRPGPWLLLSFVVRSAVVVVPLALLWRGRPAGLLSGLLGLLVARLVLVRLNTPGAKGSKQKWT